MKLLKLEFFKCRRRKILLVCGGLLAAQLLWMGVFLVRQDEADLVQGWMLLFYNLGLIDAIMLPLTVAVLASRNCEAEHKGATLKLIETMTTPEQLYTAKLCWGAVNLATLLVLRSALFVLLGVVIHLSGDIPLGRWCWFTLISWTVSMTIYTLQQGLSLRFANQAIALIFGLSGSFLGLLSMLFPMGIQRCLPWGYYGLMLLVRMDWNQSTRITTFFWRIPEMVDVCLLIAWCILFLLVGRRLFVRKEV